MVFEPAANSTSERLQMALALDIDTAQEVLENAQYDLNVSMNAKDISRI